MHRAPSLRSFGAGVLVGILVGSAGIAAAAFGYPGWQRFNDDFKTGYINGFIDMANLARNLDPGGYVDEHYPYVIKAKPQEWRQLIDDLYKDPKHQVYTITSILQLAAHRLEDKYGKGPSPEERAQERLKLQLLALRKRQEAKGLTPTVPEPALIPDKPPVLASKSGLPQKKERKWCRCDGTDPKEARAKRQAAAAAAEKEGEDDADDAAQPAKAAEATKPADATNPAGTAKPAGAAKDGEAAKAPANAASAKDAPATKAPAKHAAPAKAPATAH